MNVRELINRLLDEDQDAIVRIDSGAGVVMPARDIEYEFEDEVGIVTIK